MSRYMVALIFIFGLFVFTVPAFALQISGIYKIHQDGEMVGVEKFDITFKKDGSIKTTSTGTIKEGDTTTQSLTQANYFKDKEVKDYQRELYINKVPSKLVAVNQGNVLVVQINTGATQSERKIPTHTKTLIMDSGTFHHYHVLLNRYGKKGKNKQHFWVAAPSEVREYKLSVEFMEFGATSCENGYFEGEKIFVNHRDVGAILWRDERDKIFKIEIPMQGIMVELKDYKGKRAQKADTPKIEPFAITREDVIFKAKDGTPLAGSVTRPKNMSGPLPALIFASTAGPQDRDGLNVVGNVQTHTGKILDILTSEGYLVLRYDDRGVGGSKGDYATNAISTQVSEIQGALEFLKSRKDVQKKRIALVGHGEGANVAMKVAAGREDVKAVVLLAPCSISLTNLAIRQIKERNRLEGKTDPEEYKSSPIYRVIQMSRNTNKEFMVIGQRSVYLEVYRQWDSLDPASDIRQITQPILHVHGKNDQQVFADLAQGLKNVSKKGKYTFKLFEGLDHFFIKSDGSLGDYSRPNRKPDSEFLDYLIKWLGANL